MNYLFTKRAAAIGAMVAAVGGLCGLLMQIPTTRLEPDAFIIVAVAAIGAFIAGLLLSPAFGRSGGVGWAWAYAGATAATWGGAFIGGLLMFQNVKDALICVLVVTASIVGMPILAVVWLSAMAGVHHAASVLFPKVPAVLDLVPGPDDL